LEYRVIKRAFWLIDDQEALLISRSVCGRLLYLFLESHHDHDYHHAGHCRCGNDAQEIMNLLNSYFLPRQQKATAFGRDVAPLGREVGATGFARGVPLAGLF
jgi:hypothetical protein